MELASSQSSESNRCANKIPDAPPGSSLANSSRSRLSAKIAAAGCQEQFFHKRRQSRANSRGVDDRERSPSGRRCKS